MQLKEKRRFKRYEREIPLRVIYEHQEFDAVSFDFSFDGLGLKLFNAPKFEPGDIVDIGRTKTHVRGEYLVRWVKKAEDSLLIGLSRLDMPLGSLNDFYLADILIGLQRSNKSGTLHFKHGSIHKRIFFHNGDMVFAASNQIDDRLGEFLLSESIITKEQFDTATEHLIRTKRRLGTILVELEYIDLKTLYWGVKKQVENIILRLFEYEEGNIIFTEDELPSKEVITLKLSAAHLVTRGIKRIKSVERIRDRCPPSSAVLEFSSDPLNLFQDLQLDEEDKKILKLIDGKHTLKDIVSKGGEDVLGTMKTIIALIQTRVIKEVGEADTMASIDEDFSFGQFFMEEGELLDLEEESTLEVLMKVEELFEDYNDLTYYEFLGVEKSASFSDIRKAYYKKAMFLHPDRHYHLPEEAKEKLDSLFTYLSTAYATLMDEDLRNSYDAEISDGFASKESSPSFPDM